MKPLCNHCQALPLRDDSQNTAKEEEIQSYFNHPDLIVLSSDEGWTETFISFLCRECESVYMAYIVNNFEQEKPARYSFYRLPEKTGFVNSAYDDAAEYLYHQELMNHWEERKEKEEEYTVYSMAHVDSLTNWKNNEPLMMSKVREDIYPEFGELLNRFIAGSWVINQRYYYRVNIPVSTIETNWNTQKNHLGSGHGGFKLSTHYQPKAHEIEVLDPIKNRFVSLTDWDIPNVYEQDDPIIKTYFETYKKWAEKEKDGYEEKQSREKDRKKEIMKNKFEYQSS